MVIFPTRIAGSITEWLALEIRAGIATTVRTDGK